MALKIMYSLINLPAKISSACPQKKKPPTFVDGFLCSRDCYEADIKLDLERKNTSQNKEKSRDLEE